jgi:hypothetical protein
MPLVFVQRYAPAAIAAGTSTQAVTGTLTLGNPTYIEVDPSVFTVAGVYTIFTYGSLVGSVSSLQADLTGTVFSSAVFADTGTSITMTLS